MADSETDLTTEHMRNVSEKLTAAIYNREWALAVDLGMLAHKQRIDQRATDSLAGT
jgi:hypothetical protein